MLWYLYPGLFDSVLACNRIGPIWFRCCKPCRGSETYVRTIKTQNISHFLNRAVMQIEQMPILAEAAVSVVVDAHLVVQSRIAHSISQPCHPIRVRAAFNPTWNLVQKLPKIGINFSILIASSIRLPICLTLVGTLTATACLLTPTDSSYAGMSSSESKS